LFYDKHILRKEVALGMKVLLYDSKLHLFSGKLRSQGTGPYNFSQVFSLFCSWNSGSRKQW